MKLVSRLAVVVAVTLTLAAFLAGPVAMAKETKDSVKQISFKTKKIIDNEMVKAAQKALVEAGYKVTVDGNHPLAGHNLTFEIELVDVV